MAKSENDAVSLYIYSIRYCPLNIAPDEKRYSHFLGEVLLLGTQNIVFSLRNKKNIRTFWLKKMPCLELCIKLVMLSLEIVPLKQ